MNPLLRRLSPKATHMIRMDHSHVLTAFHQYDEDASPPQRKALANTVCLALEVHAQLEEEIFYPALREAVSGVADVVAEAEEEHQQAKRLIAQIRETGAAGAAMDQLVADLARAIEDHVKDERDELFPKARSAPGLDLAALGIQLKERQLQVMREAAPSVVRSRRG